MGIPWHLIPHPSRLITMQGNVIWTIRMARFELAVNRFTAHRINPSTTYGYFARHIGSALSGGRFTYRTTNYTAYAHIVRWLLISLPCVIITFTHATSYFNIYTQMRMILSNIFSNLHQNIYRETSACDSGELHSIFQCHNLIGLLLPYNHKGWQGLEPWFT